MSATPGQADGETPVIVVDVNDLPVTPAAAALYKLASRWWNEAFRLDRLLDQKHPRALALEDCSTALRAAVNDLRRDGDL